ncbi:unnamed protein product [Microthlaspi erraticum]|uniref:Uncharacterized protein n=1 Tax=Microthlaspi erraticum TaxID=1685480 RepID=A0A6D2J664_9BRAS|nr:unnamed protein product [Microthlaspi erraticum]
MDFIKTSSLRALIELTFQRNWNGLIWMSRKGVITKRVKTVQTALSRISAQPRSPAGRGTNVPRSAKYIRPSEVSAKVQTTRPITHHDPGNIARGRPATTATPPRTTKAREPGNASRPRNSLAYTADASVRAGKERPASGREFHRPNLNPLDQPADRESVRPRPFRLGQTRLSGRSSRTTVPTPRSTRSPFEAQTYVFKPGLTLSRL